MKSECFCTPESTDSIGYGTSTWSFSALPNDGAPFPSVAAYCHKPLRFIHWGCSSEGRASCGRGYSGSAFVGDTWKVHGVARGATFPFQTEPLSVATTAIGVMMAAMARASKHRR